MKNNFDSYIAIDWSGAETFYTKSIAIAEIQHNHDEILLIQPPEKGKWSRNHVYEWLLRLATSGKRHFIGLDANFSFCQSIFSKKLPNINNVFGLWKLIDHICEKDKNFYTESFWEHPDWKKLFWTHGSLPKNFPHEKRLTEEKCIIDKIGYPENPFKLIGTKQVGKGGLSAMRMMFQLHQELKHNVAFWPFDTDDKINSSGLVFAEIYPRLFIRKSGYGYKKIRTNEEMNSVLNSFESNFLQHDIFSDHEADAIISAAGIKKLFLSNQTSWLPNDTNDLIKYEGWIFGV